VGKPSVVIEVSPGRLRVGLMRRGRVVQSRSQAVEPFPGSGGPEPDLARMAPLAAEWLSGFKANGSECVIVYELPSTVSAVMSCPATAGAAGAMSAARLALGELAGFTLESEAGDLSTLSIDPAAGESEEPRRHTLAVADRRQPVADLTAWAEGLGLRPVLVVPMAALVLERVTSAARASSGAAAGVSARLWLGERQSVLAACKGGRIKFVRALGVGLGHLAEALTRPIRVSGSEQAVTLTSAEAWALLERAGVPQPTDVVDEARGLNGVALLPVLQPVLQRLSVDVKQSLRFGLNEAERVGLTVSVDGPGSAVPQLPESLGRLSGVAMLSAEDRWSEAEALWPGAEGAGINLLPPDRQREAAAMGARWSMRIGLCIAAGLMSLYGIHSHMALARERQSMAAIKTELERLSTRNVLSARAEAASAAERAVNQRLSAAMGEGVPAGVVLATLAQAMPEGVRLTDADLNQDRSGGPELTVRGVIESTGDDDFSDALERLAGQLRAWPMVRSTRLGAVRREAGSAGERQQFELTVALLGLPAVERRTALSEATLPPEVKP
jgi:Tfp pilus assembly protein PilN